MVLFSSFNKCEKNLSADRVIKPKITQLVTNGRTRIQIQLVHDMQSKQSLEEGTLDKGPPDGNTLGMGSGKSCSDSS